MKSNEELTNRTRKILDACQKLIDEQLNLYLSMQIDFAVIEEEEKDTLSDLPGIQASVNYYNLSDGTQIMVSCHESTMQIMNYQCINFFLGKPDVEDPNFMDYTPLLLLNVEQYMKEVF